MAVESKYQRCPQIVLQRVYPVTYMCSVFDFSDHR